jgi:hypothetical protein
MKASAKKRVVKISIILIKYPILKSGGVIFKMIYLPIGWQTSLSPGIYCDCCSHIFSQSSIVYRCMQCKVHNMCDNCAKTIHNFPPMALHPLQQWCCEKSLFLPSDLLQVTPTLTCQHYYNGNKHQYFDSRLVNLLGYCNKKISAKHNFDFLTSSICCSCY